MTFGTAILGAKKLSSKIIRVSNELLQDSGVDIEAYLAGRIAQRIGRGEAKYLVQWYRCRHTAAAKGTRGFSHRDRFCCGSGNIYLAGNEQPETRD